jgi:hypothetical protein
MSARAPPARRAARQPAFGQGVVEGVAGELVGRFQQRGRGHPVVADRGRRQEGPHHFGRHPHGPASRDPGQFIAEGRLRAHQKAGDRGEGTAVLDHLRTGFTHRHPQHAHPCGTVQDRQPQRPPGLVRHLHGHGAVRPPGKGAVDRLRAGALAVKPSASRQRHQSTLLQIRQVDHRRGRTHARGSPRHQIRQPARITGVCLLQELSHRLREGGVLHACHTSPHLPSATRTVPAQPSIRLPGAVRRGCAAPPRPARTTRRPTPAPTPGSTGEPRPRPPAPILQAAASGGDELSGCREQPQPRPVSGVVPTARRRRSRSRPAAR